MGVLQQGARRLLGPYRQLFARVPGAQGLLLSYLVVSVVFSLGIQLYGPFLRSLVECEPRPVPGARFSGSARCGDAGLVLSVAQAQEGSLVSMKLVVHALAGPFLGSFADRVGRRPMLLLSLSGYALAFLLLFLVSLQRAAHNHALVVLCFFIEGSTNAFDVVYLSMIADMTGVAERANAFAVYFFCSNTGQVVAQLLSVKILRMCLESYVAVWLGLFLVLAADVLFVWAAVHETLAPEGRREGKALLTAWGAAKAPLELVMSARFLRLWLLSSAFLSFAAGLSGVFASFSIAVYGWRPGDLQSYAWFGNLLKMASCALSPYVNRLGSPPAIILTQVVCACAAVLVQVLAPLSPAFLLGPRYAIDLLAFAHPANAAFLSSQFGADKQAKVNAVQHLCSNLSTSLSIALFSSPLMFRPGGPRTAAMWPFALSFLLELVGGTLKACLVGWHLGQTRRETRDDAVDLHEIP